MLRVLLREFSLHCICLVLLSGAVATVAPTASAAQDEIPVPQFLYHSGTSLLLLNGYTGEATPLPLEVGEEDRFAWSPDGQYLLARLHDSETDAYCLNLYDVDEAQWVYNPGLSCAVHQAKFSIDGTQIAYTVRDGTQSSVWMHRLREKASHQVYRTPEPDGVFDITLRDMHWSPTGAYLTFVYAQWVTGGTLNHLVVLDSADLTYFELDAPEHYYATYHPVWAADDLWFLIELKEEYVTNGALPKTNHAGDVYLVNSDTGEHYRLTYTPTVLKIDLHWTADGEIAFTEVIWRDHSFTLEQAMNVAVVPPERIVTPEPYVDTFHDDPLRQVMISPDPSLGAWVQDTLDGEGRRVVDLHIGGIVAQRQTTAFSLRIPDDYQTRESLIGWRPSDYSYPQG